MTKRKEAKPYSLLLIFDVFMPLMYGGRGNAFNLFNEEFEKISNREDTQPSRRYGVLVMAFLTLIPMK
jgi:hypothetical protein